MSTPLDNCPKAHVIDIIRELLQAKQPITIGNIEARLRFELSKPTIQQILDTLVKTYMVETHYSATEIGKAYFFYKVEEREKELSTDENA